MGQDPAAILAAVDECPPPPSFRMRAIAMPADLDFLLGLYADSRAREMAVLPWPEAQKHAFLAQQFTAQHGDYHSRFAERRFWVVERENRPVGRLYLAAPEAGRLRIVDLSLAARAQRRGWGGTLLRWLARAAQGAGAELELHVRQDNPARRLYERLGFHRVETRGVYDLMRQHPAQPPQAPN